jgi:hypothetical protein
VPGEHGPSAAIHAPGDLIESRSIREVNSASTRWAFVGFPHSCTGRGLIPLGALLRYVGGRRVDTIIPARIDALQPPRRPCDAAVLALCQLDRAA